MQRRPRRGLVVATAAALLAMASAASAKPARHKPAAAHRSASPSPKRTPAPAPARLPAAPADTSSSESAAASNSGDTAGAPTSGLAALGSKVKTKTYTFGAMDVEGKLKTPQLLYFLTRVKLELDMSAPDHRSFMKELEQSADDKSL